MLLSDWLNTVSVENGNPRHISCVLLHLYLLPMAILFQMFFDCAWPSFFLITAISSKLSNYHLRTFNPLGYKLAVDFRGCIQCLVLDIWALGVGRTGLFMHLAKPICGGSSGGWTGALLVYDLRARPEMLFWHRFLQLLQTMKYQFCSLSLQRLRILICEVCATCWVHTPNQTSKSVELKAAFYLSERPLESDKGPVECSLLIWT